MNALLALLVAVQSPCPRSYEGRYTDGRDFILDIKRERGVLTALPLHWTAKQLLVEAAPDSLVVADRPADRGGRWSRSAEGCITSVRLVGFGQTVELRPATGEPLPLALLYGGSPREAARAFHTRGDSLAAVLRHATTVLYGRPTATGDVTTFLQTTEQLYGESVELSNLLGDALVVRGDRAAARVQYQRVLAREAGNTNARESLALLDGVTTAADRLPFTLAQLFAPPTATEIEAVERDWATRRHAPEGVVEVATGTLRLPQGSYHVRIVSHLVRGSRHFGAILTPEQPAPGCCAVLVETKGVNPQYRPLEIETGLHLPRVLAGDANRVMIVAPSLRGEMLLFDGQRWTSEGNRADPWDGAADDARALLSVALSASPLADSTRICSFGHSRGGGVALLLAARDARVRCAVDWAGPTDWLQGMGTYGLTMQEQVADELPRGRAVVNTAGQFIEWFLQPALRGRSLEATRQHVIASSAAYFAHRLPRVQLHYGLEDAGVPARNGQLLVEALQRRATSVPRFEAYFYPGAGHDTDRIARDPLTREFLRDVLLTSGPSR